MKTYKKPVVTVDAGMAEGVYAASGAKGTLNVIFKVIVPSISDQFAIARPLPPLVPHLSHTP